MWEQIENKENKKTEEKNSGIKGLKQGPVQNPLYEKETNLYLN